ncbi:hypothetical protein [Rubripirellula tenax]|uniref:hypothetical protein n=1 Tax=Rubripirellula tenax TaxID=2528015 RepID=UPI001C94569F|nr:hypothetical protein [Rubripirellula tenax]
MEYATDETADRLRAVFVDFAKQNTKFFGGEVDEFAWPSGHRLDPGANKNKRVAIGDFKAGNHNDWSYLAAHRCSNLIVSSSITLTQ